MKKILAFGATNSKNSINKQFAFYAASRIEDAEVILLDLNDFQMPIYSIDIEQKDGIPEAAGRFKDHIRSSDAIVISFAEHNGHYTVAFKNIFDWVSRIDRNIWMNKPMILLATAPGSRGAKRVLQNAEIDMGRKNGEITGTFSLPFFRNFFSSRHGILDEDLKREFEVQLRKFKAAIITELNPVNS